MADAIFEERRLAGIYDALDPLRPDLDVYAALIEGYRARSVLDIGCGTGTFACLLAARGIEVTGVDPAAASLAVARRKWDRVLRSARAALRPGGHLVFETRDPARQAWRSWNREQSYLRADIPDTGTVETWHEVTGVRERLVSFRQTFMFHNDGAVLTSESTLRFRSQDEVTRSLESAGFTVADVRDAPDRPGKEFVFIARRAD